MEPAVSLYDGRCLIYQGHALDVLKQLPAESVQTCVTSPPYYGLRSYGTNPQVWDGDPACEHAWVAFTRQGITGGKKSPKVQIKDRENFQIVPDSQQATCEKCGAWRGELGAEPSPTLYIRHLVQIFREVRRVLHKSGTLWVNIGDSYAANRSYQVGSTKGGKKHSPAQANQTGNRVPNGMKPKDLMMIPAELALSLRNDGWWLRNDIIWQKGNAMPSSVTDRLTNSYEHIFLLSKSQTYYFDHIAIQEPATMKPQRRLTNREDHPRGDGGRPIHCRPEGGSSPVSRNKRDVWRVNTHGYKEAHFAVFNSELIEPCILAGTSECGHCRNCGKGRVRVVSKKAFGFSDERPNRGVPGRVGKGHARSTAEYPAVETLSWESSCNCDENVYEGIVLDPFAGSGTTLFTALKHGRSAIGIELNSGYCEMAVRRITQEVGEVAS